MLTPSARTEDRLAGSFDVFFSYSTRDHAVVERVAHELARYGIRIFLDRWYLTPGQPWPQELEQTLACARVNELPLSERDKERFGIEDEWCTSEVSAELRAKLEMDGQNAVIPPRPADH